MKKSKSKIAIPRPVISRGWVGVWSDGQIGWFMPNHATPFQGREADSPNPLLRQFAQPVGRIYLCRIDVKPILDKRGQPITRIVKKASAK